LNELQECGASRRFVLRTLQLSLPRTVVGSPAVVGAHDAGSGEDRAGSAQRSLRPCTAARLMTPTNANPNPAIGDIVIAAHISELRSALAIE
jgi:hypothetical protein